MRICDKQIELTMICQDCQNVQDASFILDGATGELIAEDSAGEECEQCGKANLEEVQ